MNLNRLIDLYDDWDRPDQIPPLEQELEVLLDAENERLREENQLPLQLVPSRTASKTGAQRSLLVRQRQKVQKISQKR
jgi:hypothetical protein